MPGGIAAAAPCPSSRRTCPPAPAAIACLDQVRGCHFLEAVIVESNTKTSGRRLVGHSVQRERRHHRIDLLFGQQAVPGCAVEIAACRATARDRHHAALRKASASISCFVRIARRRRRDDDPSADGRRTAGAVARSCRSHRCRSQHGRIEIWSRTSIARISHHDVARTSRPGLHPRSTDESRARSIAPQTWRAAVLPPAPHSQPQ